VSHKDKSNQIYSGNGKIDGIYHTAEWLITAFASTLVFIIFVMQVYRIPTGSMGETLFGAHFRVRCEQCGFRYNHDFMAHKYGLPNTASPSEPLPIVHQIPVPKGQPATFISSRCPSCGYFEPPSYNRGDGLFTLKNNRRDIPKVRTVYKGDQIFVLKSIYQFFEPKRWDVIVFKEPTGPRINYIKRCVGLPGETLQIIDGDIFIDGQIQRKPENVQEELWMPVYNNNYQPARPKESRFNGHPWKQPFENVDQSKWDLSPDRGKTFSLDDPSGQTHQIQYNDEIGNDFKATYGFDDPTMFQFMPICSDLMIQYQVEMPDVALAGTKAGDNSVFIPLGPTGTGVQISKYGIAYQGWVKDDGTMQIIRMDDENKEEMLAEAKCKSDDLKKNTHLRFATLDHQIVLEYGQTRLIHDLGTGIEDAGTDRQIKPDVQILGYGQLNLTHIALYRDIHYLSDDTGDTRLNALRATEDKPMVLGEDEFFACGDNSPASSDSRLWREEGIGNNGKTYPAGVVPRDYLVGKAIFVHWPGGYRLKTEPIRWIPFPDGMKIIYGGRD
jgi:signal peptidase I